MLSGLKAFVGFLAGAVSVILDAINNLSDAVSSVVTIIGLKLSKKKPDSKHPYGYGRIEYMKRGEHGFMDLNGNNKEILPF